MSAKRLAKRFVQLTQVLKQRQADLTVLCDGLTSSANIGAIMRTADCVGIGEIHLCPGSREELEDVRERISTSILKGTSKGSNCWVDLKKHETCHDAIASIKSRGIAVVATALHEKSMDFREWDWTRPTCVVVGRETTGVSSVTIQEADALIHIPQVGMVESLNVGAATAVVLYEAQRLRFANGMYDCSDVSKCDEPNRLSWQTIEQERVRLLFPPLWHFCKHHALPVPKLDEFGQIDDDEFMAIRRQIISNPQVSG